MKEYFKSISMLVGAVRACYFSNDAAYLCCWIKKIGTGLINPDWLQELREYDDTGLSDESLSIHIIGSNEVTLLVAYDEHLIKWRVKVCS